MRRKPVFLCFAMFVFLFAAACAAEPVEVEKEVTRIVEIEVPAEAMMAEKLQTNLQFVTHVAAGMTEQDIFIVNDGLADNEVIRATLEESTAEDVLGAEIYTSAGYVAHDPFALSEEPLGPFGRGEPMGITMGEWLGATGTGTYTVQENQAEVVVDFEGLVPNGTYTLWCTRITLPPDPVIFDIACGEWDGSENGFVADENGRGSLSFSMRALPDITAERISLLALAYHSDGQTFGPLPGDFGSQTHVHLLAFLPPAGDEAWQMVDG